MQVIDPDILATIRGLPSCELCGQEGRGHLHPHHLATRGMGGGSRMDVSYGLAALCYRCHDAVHMANIPREDVFHAVARREGVTVVELKERLWALMREPKE